MDTHKLASLIARCTKGDDNAKAEFIATYDDLVRRSVARKLQAAAAGSAFERDIEDICHDVYVRIFRNGCEALARIREPRSINAWLMTVAQNHVYSYLRKRQVDLSAYEAVVRETTESYEAGPEGRAVESENLTILRCKMEALDAKDRLILLLYYVHNLKYADIAETLSLNINTVASRLMRAKAKLRESLSEDLQ